MIKEAQEPADVSEIKTRGTIKTKRYSFKDERYFYYLARHRLHKEEMEAWIGIGRVIGERGSINFIDAKLIFLDKVKEDPETAKRNFPKRMKYFVENDALGESEVFESIPKEKLKKLMLR